ncbi:unnamed protein product [Plutella xylostella]|uniref:(diamondback moth) hypothetical protein n=1 Tax=Plutella xylostella TaxID=51655 RepID=A0A8S4EZC5_PLUXY|nr:unnamed protein product [Plutella xylostella]
MEAQWRRHVPDHDRYVVFAELVGKVSGWSARVSRCICVVSTCSLLLLEPRALRPRRRVPAHHVYRLSLSPHRDDLLAVHVRACPELTGSVEEVSQCSSSREPIDSAGCLFGVSIVNKFKKYM